MQFDCPVSYAYNSVKWLAISDNSPGVLQCFCHKPLTKDSKQSVRATCKACGLGVNIDVLKRLVEANAFPRFPQMRVPRCKVCNKTNLTLVRDKKTKFGVLTYQCGCTPKPAWFRCDDDNKACWEEFTNVAIASSMPTEDGVDKPVVIVTDMF